MKIYFDGTLIDEEYYSKINKSAVVYDDKLKIGATICETYDLIINKDAIRNNVPSIVTIKENNVLKKTLNVISIEDVDDVLCLIKTEDNMTKFNFKYDASEIFINGSTTLGAIFQDICTKAGVQTDIDDFYRYDLTLSIYDNTKTAREYLSYIAELNVKNFKIDANGKLIFIDVVGTSSKTITDDEISGYKIGDLHTITKVIYQDWQEGTTTGETYYINENNVYITSDEDIDYIYNLLNGFAYYDIKADDCDITDLEAGSIITFNIKNTNYPTILQYRDAEYYGNVWYDNIEINLQNEKQFETNIIDDDAKFRKIYREIDLQNGSISEVIEEQNNQKSSINRIDRDLNYTMITVGTTENILNDIIEAINTVEGTNTINITDALETKAIKYTIDGKSEQDSGASTLTPKEINNVVGIENLFNKNTTTDDCFINGNGGITSEVGICISDYIKVIPNEVYYFQNRITWKSVGVYDNNKTFISRNVISDGAYTIPSDVYYIRINLPMELKDTFLFEKGSVAHNYIPYGHWARIEVHDENNTNTQATLIDLNIYDNQGNITGHRELCGIEDVKDTLIINNNNEVIINKKINKIDSYNGETITTQYISTTGGLDIGATVYYVLDNEETINLSNASINLYENINNIIFASNIITRTFIEYYRNTPISSTYATIGQLNSLDIDKTNQILKVKSDVNARIDVESARIDVVKQVIDETGVPIVNTGTGYTFDIDGLKIEKTDEDVKSQLDNDGLSVKYKGEDVLTARSNGVGTVNITVKKFYIQKPIRMEKTKAVSDNTKIGLGFFYIGE